MCLRQDALSALLMVDVAGAKVAEAAHLRVREAFERARWSALQVSPARALALVQRLDPQLQGWSGLVPLWSNLGRLDALIEETREALAAAAAELELQEDLLELVDSGPEP
jgi:hypothetical protein